MTPQELKRSILLRAIQGKLVPQNVDDGTPEELLLLIKKDKERLIKAKLLKKEKPLGNVSEDEIPFEIPSSWRWVRLGECGAFVRGSGIKKNETSVEGKPCVRYGQLYTTYHTRFDKAISFIPEDVFEKCQKVHKNDVLMALTGENNFDIALAVAYEGEEELAMGGDMTKFTHHHMDPIYLVYAINSAYGISCKSKLATGNIIVHISNDKLASIPIPLPPLAEQHRIVAKIEELLPYIDRYEKAWTKLEEFNDRFPNDMQKSILQAAIQGKLVEQRAEEGTGEELYQQIKKEKYDLIKAKKLKKEKSLPEITENEVPFEIPGSWKWVRLIDGVCEIEDIDHKMPESVSNSGYYYISPSSFTKDGGVDFTSAKQISADDYEKLGRKCKPKNKDIIFPRYGTIGVVRIIETELPFLVSYSCCTIKTDEYGSFYKYVYYVLQSGLIKNEINRYINKTTQPNVGLASIKQFLFPMPPLAEQKRIVAKLEEILTICKRLKIE